MAVCPKCGTKLHLYNWRPECPACGVNMVYYKSNERLLEESEKTEIEHAGFQPGVDRAKASFFGSPQAVARVVISALPLACLMLPLCRLRNADGVKNINAIGIYNYISAKGFGGVFGAAAGGDGVSLALVLLLLSVVMIIVCLVCSVMSLGKHGKQRNFILNLIMLLFGAGSAVSFCLADIPASLPEYASGVPGVGIILYLLLFLTLLIYNLYLAKKGLKIEKTVCYIGGIPSDEYFEYVKQGMSELEIRKKMVEALTKMQEDVRAKAAEAEAKAAAERASWK